MKTHEKRLLFREITMPQLNKNQRLIAIGILEAGICHFDVAEHLNVSCGTIIHLAAHTENHGTVDDLPHSGRSQVMMPFQDHHIRTSHLCYHFVPATSTAMATSGGKNDRISTQTVCNRFADYG